MNVLYLQDHAGIGGAQLSLLDFLYGLRASVPNVTPHVVVGGDGYLARQLADRQLSPRVIRFPEYRKAKDLLRRHGFMRRMAELCRQQRIEVIHANTSQVAPWSAALARKLGLASCVTVREIIAVDRIRKYRVLENDAVIAISKAVQAEFPASPKVRQMYDGIARPEFLPRSAETLARLNLPSNTGQRVAFLGTLSPRKGPQVLLEAVPAIRQRFPDALFVFIGGGKDEFSQQLRAQADRLGITQSVIFAGPTETGARYLAAFDLFVMPSLAEPLGRGAVEAMYASLPVVASSAGLREIVEDGQTGRLVPPNEPRALAEAILFYLESKVRRRQHGEQGRRRAHELFDPAQYATRVVLLYSELLEARRR